MARRSRLRERAPSRSPRRRIPALGRESLVRQDFPRYPRQGTFLTGTFKSLRSMRRSHKRAQISYLRKFRRHNKITFALRNFEHPLPSASKRRDNFAYFHIMKTDKNFQDVKVTRVFRYFGSKFKYIQILTFRI